jgi:hypothetical protein
MTDTEFINQEEAKRLRNWNPQNRWLAMQEMITWAESQATVRRNTKEARLEHQRQLLARFEKC